MRLCVLGKLQTYKLQPTKFYEKGHWGCVFVDEKSLAAVRTECVGWAGNLFFLNGLRAWQKCCNKYGHLNGNYIEKKVFFVLKSNYDLCSFTVKLQTFWVSSYITFKGFKRNNLVLVRSIWKINLRSRVSGESNWLKAMMPISSCILIR